MDRREFLQQSLLAGAAATALDPAVSAQQTPSGQPSPQAPFEFEEATIAALRQRFESGELTSRRLTESYLARVVAIDRAGPRLNSVIEVNPEALEIAERLDAERKAGTPRGPLHGIPVLVKDNLDSADRMMTTAGSLALAGPAPSQDSTVVAKLREAGAVLLGKTNLSEWANFRSTRSSSGWSGRGGQTRNPYALDRNPCGSSSGSGAAPSANLCAAAIGTETDGSIVCPSTMCGLVGIKPTVGLVSRAGIVPISASQDTAGPMARTVADAAALLSAIAGVDPRDKATAASAAHRLADYTTVLDGAGLRGARIGVTRKLGRVGPKVEKVYDEAIRALREAGAVLVDPVDFDHVRELGDAEYQVLLYEFKAGLDAYFATRAGVPARTLAGLIAFNDQHAAEELKYFGQEILLESQKKGPLTEPAYLKARRTCVELSRDKGIDALVKKHRLDAIVAPTGGPAWLIDLVNGDSDTGGSSTIAAVAGYPNVTVPMGMVHGLPVGLSIFGSAWSEPTLVKLAYAFEQATKARRPPTMVATLPLESYP